MNPLFANHHFAIETYKAGPGFVKCNLCGDMFLEEEFAAALINGKARFESLQPEIANTASPTKGHICADCLRGGPVGAAERVRARVEHDKKESRALFGTIEPGFEQNLNILHSMADHLATTPTENWLSAREIDALHLRKIDLSKPAADEAPTQ